MRNVEIQIAKNREILKLETRFFAAARNITGSFVYAEELLGRNGDLLLFAVAIQAIDGWVGNFGVCSQLHPVDTGSASRIRVNGSSALKADNSRNATFVSSTAFAATFLYYSLFLILHPTIISPIQFDKPARTKYYSVYQKSILQPSAVCSSSSSSSSRVSSNLSDCKLHQE